MRGGNAIIENAIKPVFIGIITAIAITALMKLFPLFDLNFELSRQLAISEITSFLLICLVAILYTRLYLFIISRKTDLKSSILAGLFFGFLAFIFALLLLLMVSVITASIIAANELKPFLLSLLICHLSGGIAIATLTQIFNRRRHTLYTSNGFQ